MDRSYGGRSDHVMIAFSLTIAVSGAGIGDLLQIEMNDIAVGTLSVTSSSTSAAEQFKITGKVAHTINDLVFQVKSLLTASSTLQFGIQEFSFNLYTATSYTSPSFCGDLINGNRQISPACSCPITQIYVDGACQACSTGCSQCIVDNGVELCTKCNSGSSYKWNGAACVKSCGGSQWFYPDQICQASCDTAFQAPLTACLSPCENGEYYYVAEQNCQSTCEGPYEAQTVHGIKQCVQVCPTDYYWFYSQSCTSTCDYPLYSSTDSNGLKICSNPCYYDDVKMAYVNKYLYPDQTCGSTCPSPFIQNSPGLCVSPCENSQLYFYEVEQKCLSTCEYPYEPKQISTLKLCYLAESLSLEQVLDLKSMVSKLTTANKVGAAASQVTSSVSSTSSAFAFLAAQVSMLFSIRYIDVGYPDKVKLMFKLQGESPFSISFDFNVPEFVEIKLAKKSPPEIFEKYGVSSSFLENTCDTLVTLVLILLAILVLSVVVKKVFKGRCAIVGRVFNGVLEFLKWNIPLMIFCSSFGDMYFFASLQFQAGIANGSVWEAISLILATLMFIIGIVIIITPLKIAKDMLGDQNSQKKWKNVEHLFDGQKRTSLASFCFLAFYQSIAIITNLLIANLYAYPLCQSLLITVISVVMFLFLLIQRPLNAAKITLQVLVNQLLLVVVNVCVVILAVMDDLEIGGQDIRDKVGEVIIVTFYCSMASGLVFSAIEMCFEMFFVVKFLKKLKAEQGSITMKGIFNELFHGNPIEKKKETTDLEQRRRKVPSGIHRQSTDLSLGGKIISLQPQRKGRNLQKNISFQNSNNTSGIDLIHNQTSDYSFDYSGQLDASPSRGRLPNQQRLNVNRQIPRQNSNYSVEILNHLPLKLEKRLKSPQKSQPQQNDMVQPHLKSNDNGKTRRVQKISNVSNPRRMANQTGSQSRSHSPKRKNQIQKGKKILNQSEGKK